jgi:hypothetical protein
MSKLQVEDDYLIFSSGRRLRANFGMVSLRTDNGEDFCVGDGCDGEISTPASREGIDVDWNGEPYSSPAPGELTPAECIELADQMLLRWSAFRTKYVRGLASET